MAKFKLTAEEANVLDKIAFATGMDSWFYINEKLEAEDVEGDCDTSDSCVRMLESGLVCDVDQPEGGGLTPKEREIAERCFARARAIADKAKAENPRLWRMAERWLQ